MFAFVDNWRLARKMLVAFALLALLTGALAVNGFLSNRGLTSIAKTHVEQGVASMSSLAEVMSDIKELRIIIYSFYNAVDAKEETKLRGRLAKSSDKLMTDIAGFEKVAGEDFRTEVEKLRQSAGSLNEINERIFAARGAGDLPGALALIKRDGLDRSHDAIDQTQKLLDMSRARSNAANVRGMADSTSALGFTIVLSLLSFAGLGGAWLLINRTVAKPMGDLTRATTLLAEGGKTDVPHRNRADEIGQIAGAVEQFRVAALQRAEADARSAAEQQVVTSTLRDSLAALSEGDLTATITADYPDAYVELRTNFNEAVASLRALIGSVMESTATIRVGANEIAQASEDLARRTEANAASLEQTSAAVTQMDERLRETAAAAGRTVERADGAIATVTGGRGIADEAVRAMTRVSESAQGIDSVIEGLDKIAFQTRVLAMNAAVEAGRAGEAGRGFAVVADLVSALAMRAEEEAGRAREQLTTTQTDIVAAVEMVQKVDGALADISSDVGEVHALLGRIAEDNQAQSSSVTQVSTAIGAMDQSTQQNAAMVEQTSAAARNLSSEVAGLADQAARFNTGQGTRQPAPTVAPALRAKPKKATGYVSPVKALPVAAMANGASHDDWTSF